MNDELDDLIVDWAVNCCPGLLMDEELFREFCRFVRQIYRSAYRQGRRAKYEFITEPKEN